MIEITSMAGEKLTAYISQNNIQSPVRIYAANGCSGPSLALALDERKKNDFAYEHDNFTLVIDPSVTRLCGKVTIDYVEQTSGCGCGGNSGFSLSSEKPLNTGGGCGSSCSSSGCGC